MLFRHIGGVLPQNTDIGSQILPLLLTSSSFYEAGKLAVLVEATHQPDVMSDGRKLQLVDNLFPLQKNNFAHLRMRRFFRLCRKVLWKFCVHSVFFHIILKVFQFVVNLLVAKLFRIVHVIQLAQNHVISLC